MVGIILIVSVIAILFLRLVIFTYGRLTLYDISFPNKLNYVMVIWELFQLHYHAIIKKEVGLLHKVKATVSFFNHYSLALTFLIEIILESVAEYEVTGDSKYLTKVDKPKASRSMWELIKEIVEQPFPKEQYTKLVGMY